MIEETERSFRNSSRPDHYDIHLSLVECLHRIKTDIEFALSFANLSFLVFLLELENAILK